MCGTCSRYKRLVRLFSPKGKSTIRSLYTFVSGVGGRAAALIYIYCYTSLHQTIPGSTTLKRTKLY